jgi:3-oxoacyl-[acyl-carrier-protein] synthase II
MGVVTALGMDETTLWQNMLAGHSGIRQLTLFDVSEYKCKNGSEIATDALTKALQSRKLTVSDRTVDMALIASAQALESAGIISGEPPYEPQNTAVIFGSGVGASHSLYNAFIGYSQKGIRGLRPTSVPRCMANSISAQISMRFRLIGSNYMIVSACTSASNTIGAAFRMIRDGYTDRVLCGGSDSVFDPFVMGGWNNLGVMSKNPDPTKACRPFDAARDGCVLGEGAGALVIESLNEAQERGARIRAEICGFGESSDAEHITSPSAEGQARAISAALKCAGLQPGDIGFINAHGTATRANDECESQSIRLVLKEAADRIPVASNKSFFGHLLGASGAVETIVTVLGLENGKAPPNLNLDNPDPACNLTFVGNTTMDVPSPIAMKNSFGFGGDNAVLIVRRWDR